MRDSEKYKILSNFITYLIDNKIAIDPEYIKVVNDNFWELIDDNTDDDKKDNN